MKAQVVLNGRWWVKDVTFCSDHQHKAIQSLGQEKCTDMHEMMLEYIHVTVVVQNRKC